MKRPDRYGVAFAAFLTLMLSASAVRSLSAAGGQGNEKDKGEYAIKLMPPGGPAPRLADGHPDF